jgi:hypothetical protein
LVGPMVTCTSIRWRRRRQEDCRCKPVVTNAWVEGWLSRLAIRRQQGHRDHRLQGITCDLAATPIRMLGSRAHQDLCLGHPDALVTADLGRRTTVPCGPPSGKLMRSTAMCGQRWQTGRPPQGDPTHDAFGYFARPWHRIIALRAFD